MDKVSGPAMQIHPNYMLNIGQEKNSEFQVFRVLGWIWNTDESGLLIFQNRRITI